MFRRASGGSGGGGGVSAACDGMAAPPSCGMSIRSGAIEQLFEDISYTPFKVYVDDTVVLDNMVNNVSFHNGYLAMV